MITGKESSSIGALNVLLFGLAEGFSEESPEIEERRSWLILDWGVRVYLPEWLDLDPLLTKHAKVLREGEEIRNEESWHRVQLLLTAAEHAANSSWEAESVSAAWAAHALGTVVSSGMSAVASDHGDRGAAGDVWCKSQKALGTTNDERFVRTSRKLQKMAVELLGRVLEVE